MENSLRDWVPQPFTNDTAFVVHLGAKAADPSAGLRGRVEHVRSGQARRFGSIEELVTFMCQALANQSESACTSNSGETK